MKPRLLAAALLAFFAGTASQAADPTLQAQCPPVFGDHAILQQGIPVPVWGRSLPGAKVTVQIDQQSKETVADGDGQWRVALDPMPADKLDALDQVPAGHALTILTTRDGKQATKQFKGVLIGEVWLCSGQSNMAGKVKHNAANQDPNDRLTQSNLPAIRQFASGGTWIQATPPDVRDFTRVGFCFARKVQREIKVPVGLVNASTGGSRIESWMRVPPQGLPEDPQAKKVTYGKLYEQHIVPLIGYGMRGALWYQGEANANEGSTYLQKMEALINDWRSTWNLGDFPFYFVQLAGIGLSSTEHPAMGDGRARIREAQRHALRIKHTGMAVATDIGDEREHPGNKSEVGERLAHWALHHDYDRKELLPSGPLYQGFKIEGQRIRITFKYAEGLHAATKTDYVPPRPAPGKKIDWLSIQDPQGAWHWAEGNIVGEELVVSSPAVSHPLAVRYAFTNRPIGVTLYNRQSLPASPFTTEAEKIITE